MSASVWKAVRSRRWMQRPDRVIGWAVFVLTFLLVCSKAIGAPSFADDEGTYAAQAMSVQQGGLAPYTYWYDHPPLGWIQLAILSPVPQLLISSSQLDAMRLVAAALFASAATLVYLLARRVNAPIPFAILAVAVYVLSPLSLSVGRMLFLDTVGVPWVLLALYLALSPSRAMWSHVGAGASYAIAVLTKLTLAAFGPAILAAILSQRRWNGRKFSLAGFFLTGGLLMMLYPVFAALRGELFSGPGHVSLQDGMMYQFATRSGSGGLFEAGSPRNELFWSWFAADPFLILGGGIAGVLCLASKNARWIGIGLAGFALPLVVGTGYMPAMYIIAALPFLALAVGVAAHRLSWHARKRLAKSTNLFAGWRRLGLASSAVVCAALLAVSLNQWPARAAVQAAPDGNADWRSTLAWVDANVSRDDVIVVPYSMLPDLRERGWKDRWGAIALEKVDLDSEFDAVRPGGWREIDWIIEGPTVAANISYLGLEEMRQAYESSTVVQNFGGWNVRKVQPDPSAAAPGEQPSGQQSSGQDSRGQKPPAAEAPGSEPRGDEPQEDSTPRPWRPWDDTSQPGEQPRADESKDDATPRPWRPWDTPSPAPNTMTR